MAKGSFQIASAFLTGFFAHTFQRTIIAQNDGLEKKVIPYEAVILNGGRALALSE